MSRTDKDLPWWYSTETDPGRIAEHYWMCEESRYDVMYPDRAHPCDLYAPRHRWKACCWRLPHDRRWWYNRGPTVVERRLYWYGPARNEENRRLGDAIKDYRANGDVDHVDLDHQQHRHATSWDLW